MIASRGCAARIAAIFVAFALAAGCGDDDSSDGGATADTTSPASATTAPDSPSTSSSVAPTSSPSTSIGSEERVLQLALVDDSRSTAAEGGTEGAPDRSLPTTVYLPEGDEPAPLIVLAHGAAGLPEVFTELAGYWSDAGYAIAVPRFPLSNRDVPEPFIGDVAEQGRDVSFVIDEVLAANNRMGDPLTGRIDPERIGLFGLSLGSLTVWNTMFGDCCGEDRVNALIQSDGAFPLPKERLADVAFPVMIAHSDTDPIFPYEQIRTEYGNLTEPKYLLTLHRAFHATVAEDTDTPADLAYQQATTVFWDRHLAGETEAPFPDEVQIEGVTTLES